MAEVSKEYYAKPEDSGSVQISEEVIASIAALAVNEIEGVAGLVSDFTSDIVGMLGRKSLSRGIKILFIEDSVDVEVYISVRFGFVIPEVAKKVQDAVADAVESMTGLAVGAVNIHVVGIVFDKETPHTQKELKCENSLGEDNAEKDPE